MITKPFVISVGLLLLGCTVCSLPTVHAGDFGLRDASDGKDATLDEGRFDRQRFVFTFDARGGYDDNSRDQPDEISVQVLNPVTGRTRTVTRQGDVDESFFMNYDASLAYTAANSRASLGIAADVGINYYFDRSGRSYDINSGLTLHATYKLSPRAALEFSNFEAYESEPDFGASNLTGFTGEVGQGVTFPGTSAQRNGDYFFSTNHIALTYQFTPRISTVTSGDLVAFAFISEPFATIEDRVELYADEQFVYLLKPTLSAVGEYRISYIDYFSVNNDSVSHFLLAGANYSFNPRLKGIIRGGVEFREYLDAHEDDVSPYFEGTLTYDLSARANIALVSRYSIEEGDLSSAVSNSRAFRLGIDFNDALTQRLRGYVSIYYTHNDYHSESDIESNTGIFDGGSFDEDSIEIAAGLKYSFNRRISVDVGYTHTDVLSGVDAREYDRNRYFAGVRFEF